MLKSGSSSGSGVSRAKSVVSGKKNETMTWLENEIELQKEPALIEQNTLKKSLNRPCLHRILFLHNRLRSKTKRKSEKILQMFAMHFIISITAIFHITRINKTFYAAVNRCSLRSAILFLTQTMLTLVNLIRGLRGKHITFWNYS